MTQVQEHDFQIVFNLAAVGLAYVNPLTGKFLIANSKMEEITGYSNAELCKMSFSDLTHPEDREKDLAGYRAMIEGKTTIYTTEKRYVRKDGKIIYVLIHVAPIRDDNGTVNKTVGVIQDITSRKQAERILKESEQRYRLLTENSPDAILVESKNRILYCNPAATQLLKAESEVQLLGKPFLDLIQNEYRDKLSKTLSTQSQPNHQLTEAKVLCYDNSTADVSIASNSISYFGHEATEFVIRSNSELRKTVKRAEDSNRAKSAFLANISHEIRTPLGVILGFSELLADPNAKPEERSHYVEIIKHSGEHLSQIINDILDISKIESGKIEIIPQAFHLANFMSEIHRLTTAIGFRKGLQVKLNLDPDLPSVVKSDPLRLRQILLNLIGNAIKFTNTGMIHINVHSKERKKNKCLLEFEISDSGTGIPHHLLTKLFKPFSQLDTNTQRKLPGTGLGLVLSKNLAKLLGGDVILKKTELDKGSVFVASVEATPLNRPPKESQNQIRLCSNEKINLTGIKILLAEDSEDNQMLFKSLLSLAGAEVSIANNGAEAVNLLREHDYDLILMDLQMPVKDGFVAAEEIRHLGYKKPIIALSAHALNSDIRKCKNCGFDAHLSKPVSRIVLLETVRKLVPNQLAIEFQTKADLLQTPH